MELTDHLPELDAGLKIPAALALLLLVGLFASNTVNNSEILPHSTYSGEIEKEHDRKEVGSNYVESGKRESTETDSFEDKVVTTYRMTLRVSNVDGAMKDIESVARTKGGFVESRSRSHDYDNTGRITVSIPANISSSYEEYLENRFKVRSKDVDRRNVKDSYSKLQAEIKTLETEHQRLNELINQTEDVETLIKLQERLSTVRSELDYRKQRLGELQEDIKYSTFRINLKGPQRFESRFELQETFSDAYTAVFESLKFIIIGTGYLAPFAFIYGLYRAGRRIKARGI